MSIVDVFYMIFKADTSDLKKGLKDADDAGKKLNDSTKKSNDLTKKLGLSFSDLAAEFTGLVASFVSVSSIIQGLKSAQEYSYGLFQASRQLGSSTEEIDAWGRAVAKQGGSLQSFESSLTNLNTALNTLSISPNNELVATFYKLGISVRDNKGGIKSALSLFYELADASQRIKPQQAKTLFSQLGIDPATTQLLLNNRKEIEKIIEVEKKLGVTTVENSQIANQFHNTWLDTSQAFTTVFQNLNTDLLPVLSKLLNVFKDVALFFQNHHEALTGAITGLATSISLILIPSLIALGVALTPEIALTAGLITLGAAVGYVYGKLKNLSSEDIKNAFVQHQKAPELFHRIGIAVGEVHKKLTETGEILLSVWEKLEKIIHSILSTISSGYSKIKDFFNFGNKNEEPTKTSFAANAINPELVKSGQGILSNTANLPLALQNATSLHYNNPVTSRALNIDVGNITIQTQATSADEIAANFKDNLINQVRLAINQHNDGVVI